MAYEVSSLIFSLVNSSSKVIYDFLSKMSSVLIWMDESLMIWTDDISFLRNDLNLTRISSIICLYTGKNDYLFNSASLKMIFIAYWLAILDYPSIFLRYLRKFIMIWLLGFFKTSLGSSLMRLLSITWSK